MILQLCQTFVACGAVLFAWYILPRYAFKSVLDNIPGPPTVSFVRGNFGQLFNPRAWPFHKYLYENYSKVIKINGFFGKKELFVYDPLALHHIIVKDQQVYEETSPFIDGNRVIFGPGLLSTLGDHHKRQRKMLNPVFSIAHLRNMVPMFHAITHQLREAITSKLANGPAELDMLTFMSRTSLELIGQAGLGYSFESLNEDTANPYSQAVKRFMPALTGLLLPRMFAPWTIRVGPAWLRKSVMNIIPWTALHNVRDIVDVMHSTSTEVFRSKQRALEEGDASVLKQVGQGKDIMSILMKANMEASEADRLPDEELLGQMTTLIFAAFDTTSSALSRILSLLALNPEVQDKLRSEVTNARLNKGDLDYTDLSALPYLEAVCRETLRVYAPVPTVMRITRKDIVMPLSVPIKGLDGSEIRSLPVPKDTTVIVGILAANLDPSIWGEDAAEWKPERWLKPLPESVAAAHLPGVYGNMMTFLGGGRACIGFKFSELEIKTVISVLLETFSFAPSEEIVWSMMGVRWPEIKGCAGKAQLPLRVSLVKASPL